MRRPVVAAVLALTVGSSLAAVSDPVQAASPSVHVTAVGDYAALSNTSKVLSAVKAADPDAHFALGDFSYGTTGEEQRWCDFVTARVGTGFPFELITGNHESDGINGNIDEFASCLPNRLPGVVGTYAKRYYVDYPQGDPVVRFVMISPGITFPDGFRGYRQGSGDYLWTAAAIDGARSAGIPWVVVGMHKPCLTLGNHTCESGADLTDLLLRKKVDLVLAGHEHLYGRTKQLALRTGCASLAVETYEANCVADADDRLAQGAGTAFVTVGTGGVNLGPVNPDDAERPYFAEVSGSNSNPSFGYVDLVADADQLTARFVPVTGSFGDAFTITRGAPATTAPVETTPATTAPVETAPSGFAADAFSRAVSSGWGTADAGGAWTVAPAAQGSVSSGVGRLRLPTAGAGPGAHLVGATSSSTDLSATVSVDKVATGSGTYVWLRGRRAPGGGGYRTKLWWKLGNVVRLSLSRGDAAGVETAIGPSVFLAGGVTAGEQLRVRTQVTGTSPTTLRAKVWRLGETEPSAWMVSATDSTAGLQVGGSVGVTTYLSTSATNAPVTVSIGDWRAVTP
jgi:hypothetical protein